MLLYFTKRVVFTRRKVLKRGSYFIFAYVYFHEHVLYKVFTRKLELLQTTLNFIFIFSYLKPFHKNEPHGSHHPPSNMFYKNVIILTFHICM